MSLCAAKVRQHEKIEIKRNIPKNTSLTRYRNTKRVDSCDSKVAQPEAQAHTFVPDRSKMEVPLGQATCYRKAAIC